MSSLVEVPTKKEDSSSDEDRSGSGVEDALFCFKKFSLRLLLQRIELGLIRFFHRSGSLGLPHICHFFYTGKIFVEKNLHQKMPILCVKSEKNANFSC